MIGMLWGAAGLTSLGKYLLIGVAGLFAMGWMVNGITAPYRAQVAGLKVEITSLKQAATKRAELEAKDAARAEAAEIELARLNATLESVIHESKASSCVLAPAERDRLLDLANGGARRQ